MKKIAFIVHGKLRGNHSLHQEILNALSKDEESKFFYTERSFHAFELSQQAVAEGYEYIISVTGDGTLNEVLNGVMAAGNKNVKVGVLPHGSGNDFVKTTQSPNRIDGLIKLIREQQFKTIDLLKADFTSPDGKPTSRYGNNITDVGIGGEIAYKLHGSKKILGATITFQYYILSTFLTYKPKPIVVRADSFSYENPVMNFCVCNGKYFGAGLGVSPEADLQDGLLNVVSIGNVNLFDYLKNFPTIKKCKRIKHSGVKYFTAKEISIETAEKNMPIDMDGEFIGFLPMKIKVVPAAVQFIC